MLGLRGTITKLKQENQQLSTALQRSRSNSNSGSRDSARRAKAEAEYQQVSKAAHPCHHSVKPYTLDCTPGAAQVLGPRCRQIIARVAIYGI